MSNQKELLDKYVEAVMNAPSSLSLTAARDPAVFWERHVLDALKILELLPDAWRKKTMRVLDVGSGNGIPGVPLAIAMPSWQVSLLDSNKKKCGFLDMFCKFNDIGNVRLLVGRAEKLGQSIERETYDLVFARALGKLPSALELASPFVKVGGWIVVPHGTSWEQELANSKRAMAELGINLQDAISYKLGTSFGYRVLIFSKSRETSEKYPRAIGVPTKRPL